MGGSKACRIADANKRRHAAIQRVEIEPTVCVSQRCVHGHRHRHESRMDYLLNTSES